jgi:two-component system, cell cycle response regulator DivK
MSAARVLIVDDNPMNVELASFVLVEGGFTVAVAVDAVEAQALVRAFVPDLILMDIQLPGMDGLKLSRLFKSDPATRGITIVAFTSFAMKGDEAKMRAAGCDGYLSKPIEVSTFADTIRAYLEGPPDSVRGRLGPP